MELSASAFLVLIVLAACGGGAPAGGPPTISEIIPSSAIAGSEALALVVTGTNFVAGSTVRWNTANRPTTLLSSTQLQVRLSASDLVVGGVFYISVENPAPDFRTADSVAFSVTGRLAGYPVLEIPQAANDIAWDSTSGLIYLSVPSTASAYGNSIAAMDPASGTIVGSQYAGSEPSRLALSDDNQFLYVGLNGAAAVARFALPSLSPSLEYSLGATNSNGPLFVLDLQVAPGTPHTSAVSVGASSLYGWAPSVTIFDDAEPRSLQPYGDLDSLQWGADAAHLFAANNDTTSFDFFSLGVTASGPSIAADYAGVEPWLGLFGSGRIHFDRGTKLIYSDNSLVIDPTNGTVVGAFPLGGWLLPDSANNRVFVLYVPGPTSIAIEVYDLNSAVLIASIPLPNIQGVPSEFIRWGARGLAFCTNAGFIYIVTGGFVDGSG